MLAEDHPLFAGVCAGVGADRVVLDLFGRADLLVGVGFEPVESDKLWHQTMPLVNVGPLSIAAREFRPAAEAVGAVPETLAALAARAWPAFGWEPDTVPRVREALAQALRPVEAPRGLSGYELTRALRALMPRDTILCTDVGSVKFVTTQAWTSYAPLTFFESNGLSAMSYSLPAAMAARLEFPDRPVLCTIGDGGFGMSHAEIETCVRERIHVLTVVYNDDALSLIDVAQHGRGYPNHGVRYGRVDFAAVAAGLGAWSRRVETMEALEAAVKEGLAVDRPVVIDAAVDPSEYGARRSPAR
jgi:acetolactate synthase I/II/III large subunit